MFEGLLHVKTMYILKHIEQLSTAGFLFVEIPLINNYLKNLKCRACCKNKKLNIHMWHDLYQLPIVMKLQKEELN